MHLIQRIRPAVAAGLAVVAGSAAAHTGEHTVAGFASGFSHPFAGLDHLLAMVAVGLWAVQQGGRALWAVPAAFVLAMLGGGALAGWGIALPYVETGIALSVLVLGLVVAARRDAPVAIGVAVAGGFALFHGHAHGLEMPQAVAPALYGLGFVLATSALHAAGVAAAWFGPRAVRVTGAGIAATGAALLWLA